MGHPAEGDGLSFVVSHILESRCGAPGLILLRILGEERFEWLWQFFHAHLWNPFWRAAVRRLNKRPNELQSARQNFLEVNAARFPGGAVCRVLSSEGLADYPINLWAIEALLNGPASGNLQAICLPASGPTD